MTLHILYGLVLGILAATFIELWAPDNDFPEFTDLTNLPR